MDEADSSSEERETIATFLTRKPSIEELNRTRNFNKEFDKTPKQDFLDECLIGKSTEKILDLNVNTDKWYMILESEITEKLNIFEGIYRHSWI